MQPTAMLSTETKTPSGALVLDKGDPMETARRFLADRHMKGNEPQIRKHKGNIFKRTDFGIADMAPWWNVLPNHTITEQIWNYLDGASVRSRDGFARYKPTKRGVQEVKEALVAVLEPLPTEASKKHDQTTAQIANWGTVYGR